MSEINVSRHQPAPVIESVTLKLTEAEARALLRVIKAPGRETLSEARMAALGDGDYGVYNIGSQLRRALS